MSPVEFVEARTALVVELQALEVGESMPLERGRAVVRDRTGYRYYRHGQAAGVCTGPAGSHPIADCIMYDRTGVII